jgi:RNA polymerase sigma-70 factor (ECF subfamily)
MTQEGMEEADDGTDLDLRGLRSREPGAVERWFLEYADGLYSFVYYRVGRDADLAADVCQETFVEALENFAGFDPGRGSMFSWLACTARNRIRRALRLKGRFSPGLERWEAIDRDLLRARDGIDPSPLPEELLERRERDDLVRMALSTLPFRYGKVLRRHYCRREPLARIAASEGMTEGAVKALLHRARLAFKAAYTTIGRRCVPAAQEKETP